MSAPMVAVFRIGYQDYMVPAHRVQALVEMLADMQALESKYDSDEGYVYWPAKAKDQEQTITLKPAQSIRSAEPQKVVVVHPPDPPKPSDERVIAAPTAADPIAIKSVPPMREFVDEFRHDEGGPL